MYGIYANETGVFVDGKWHTINMAYIRILWDMETYHSNHPKTNFS